jgi:hypothetical protein
MPAARPDEGTTRVTVTDGMIKLVIAIFVVPAPFEFVLGVIKKEQYDFTRLGIIVGVLVVLALLLILLRHRQLRVQAIVGYYLLLAGSVVAAFGIIVTFRSDLIVARTAWTPTVEVLISALGPSLGLLLVAAGLYLIAEQRRRIQNELEFPSPSNISSPRTIKLNDDNAALWKSDLFTEHPGAETVVSLCKEYLSAEDLHFIAYYANSGECLFYLDCLDEDAMARFDVRDTPDRRRQYERHGRHVRHLATNLDRRFAGIDSGAMVRIVLDVKKGALYYYSLEHEGFLLGVTLDQRRVDDADSKLSELASRILLIRGGMASQDFTIRLPHEPHD